MTPCVIDDPIDDKGHFTYVEQIRVPTLKPEDPVIPASNILAFSTLLARSRYDRSGVSKLKTLLRKAQK
mgnify:FL=1